MLTIIIFLYIIIRGLKYSHPTKIDRVLIEIVHLGAKNYLMFNLTSWLSTPLSRLASDEETRLWVKVWGQV